MQTEACSIGSYEKVNKRRNNLWTVITIFRSSAETLVSSEAAKLRKTREKLNFSEKSAFNEGNDN